MVVEYENQIFVMEFKILIDNDVGKTLHKGMEQIKERGYADLYKPESEKNTVHLIVLAFNSQERNIVGISTEVFLFQDSQKSPHHPL